MYSKRAFVHWYVGEGMEEVRLAAFIVGTSLTSLRIFRASSLKLVRISQRLRKIMKRLARIPLILRRKASIKEIISGYSSLFFCVFFDAAISAIKYPLSYRLSLGFFFCIFFYTTILWHSMSIWVLIEYHLSTINHVVNDL